MVKYQDYVEGVEFLSCDCEGKANEYGVEYHAELEDEYCGHLRRVVFYFVRRFVGFGVDGWFLGGRVVLIIVIDVFAGVGEVVFAWCMFLAV